jgi:DNA-binding MarR family transcriptional regulator
MMNDITTNAHRMIRLFEQMRHAKAGPGSERLKELNLSFSHLRALHLLAPDRVLSMKDLAEALQMTPPSVTAVTRRMLQCGLMQRTAHAEDSRITLLSLTDAGRDLQQRIDREHIERMTQLLQGLSEQEQQQFLDLLERAVNALRTATPHEGAVNALRAAASHAETPDDSPAPSQE